MRQNSILIAGLCVGILLSASFSPAAAEHRMDEDVLSGIPKNLKAVIDSGQSSGVVTLVARNGEIASIDAVGWRIMDKEPLETTDVFWAASITKPFVAVAIMMMVDEGHLELDDLVEKHIPEFKGRSSQESRQKSGNKNHQAASAFIGEGHADVGAWNEMEVRGRGPLCRRLYRRNVFRLALCRVSEDPNPRSSRHDKHILHHQGRAREPGGPET